MLTHLPADRGQYPVTVVQLDADHRIGQGLYHGAFEFECSLFLRQFTPDLRSRMDVTAGRQACRHNKPR